MTQSSHNLNFIFINGKGSGGKDTQADKLLQVIPDSVRLSTGDIYRGAKSQTGEYAEFYSVFEPYIEGVDKHGQLIPDEVIMPVVQTVIERLSETGTTTFIFTGFPRTIPQLESTDKLMASLKEKYDVNEEFVCVAVLDIHSRRRSKARYDSDLAKGNEPRPDDNPATVEKRLEAYRENTQPMLHKLAREGRLTVIKGSGGVQEVWGKLITRLEKEDTTLFRRSKEC